MLDTIYKQFGIWYSDVSEVWYLHDRTFNIEVRLFAGVEGQNALDTTYRKFDIWYLNISEFWYSDTSRCFRCDILYFRRWPKFQPKKRRSAFYLSPLACAQWFGVGAFNIDDWERSSLFDRYHNYQRAYVYSMHLLVLSCLVAFFRGCRWFRV